MGLLNIGIALLLFMLAAAVPPANRHREPTDNLRVFHAFPHAVAASTSSNNTAFKCSSATRTHFDPKAKSVKYVWHFKAHSGHPKRDVLFDVSFGATPGQGTFTINNDTAHKYTAFYEYSDYDSCLVMKFLFEGHQHCTLWIKESVKHNIPKHCVDNYKGTCVHRVSLIDRNICNDEDD